MLILCQLGQTMSTAWTLGGSVSHVTFTQHTSAWRAFMWLCCQEGEEQLEKKLPPWLFLFLWLLGDCCPRFRKDLRWSAFYERQHYLWRKWTSRQTHLQIIRWCLEKSSLAQNREWRGACGDIPPCGDLCKGMSHYTQSLKGSLQPLIVLAFL